VEIRETPLAVTPDNHWRLEGDGDAPLAANVLEAYRRVKLHAGRLMRLTMDLLASHGN